VWEFKIVWNQKSVGLSVGAGQLSLAVASRQGEGWALQKTGVEPLEPGLCHPSPLEKNIADLARWKQHVATLLGKFDGIRSVTLALPDSSVRTLILTLQQVPKVRLDFEKLIRWHMEKSFLHPLGEARFSYQILLRSATQTKLLATAVKREVIEQYESIHLSSNGGAVSGSEIEISRVGPTFLYVLNLFCPLITPTGAKNFLFVRISDQILTLVIFEEGLPNLVRVKEFPEVDQWDRALIEELNTSLSFYEAGGNSTSALTHLFLVLDPPVRVDADLRASLHLTVVQLDPRGVLRSGVGDGGLDGPVISAAAAAAGGK
jgi:hypothetical protein